MKLEEGMYVRTKYGIAKYIHKLVTKETIYYVIDKKIVYENVEDWEDVLLSNEILKASHNIIDLIEVGDYVNGHKVYDDFRLDTDDYGISFIEIGVESDKFLNHYIREEDIKSIVTKEQFSSMEYRLGDK